jgi:hypothetical protein
MGEKGPTGGDWKRRNRLRRREWESNPARYERAPWGCKDPLSDHPTGLPPHLLSELYVAARRSQILIIVELNVV